RRSRTAEAAMCGAPAARVDASAACGGSVKALMKDLSKLVIVAPARLDQGDELRRPAPDRPPQFRGQRFEPPDRPWPPAERWLLAMRARQAFEARALSRAWSLRSCRAPLREFQPEPRCYPAARS